MQAFCSRVPVVTYSTVSRTADVYARTMRYNAFETEIEVRLVVRMHSKNPEGVPSAACLRAGLHSPVSWAGASQQLAVDSLAHTRLPVQHMPLHPATVCV